MEQEWKGQNLPKKGRRGKKRFKPNGEYEEKDPDHTARTTASRGTRNEDNSESPRAELQKRERTGLMV